MLGPDEIPSYHFKFPPHQNVIDALGGQKRKGGQPEFAGPTKQFEGMNPLLMEKEVSDALPFLKDQGCSTERQELIRQMDSLKALAGSPDQTLVFDSSFESGNLDMVIQVDRSEFDMFMRVDSNTRGHHQWFYFKVENRKRVGTVKFNFINFTKRQSLYMHGMRVNVKSMLDIKGRRERLGTQKLPNDGWVKAGSNITYKLSKLSQPGSAYNTNYGNRYDGESPLVRPLRRKKYYQLSFDYTFTREDDVVYFAYAIPYTFSKLHNLLKDVMRAHDEESIRTPVSANPQYIRESKFCHSLSGLEVPMLTITSNV